VITKSRVLINRRLPVLLAERWSGWRQESEPPAPAEGCCGFPAYDPNNRLLEVVTSKKGTGLVTHKVPSKPCLNKSLIYRGYCKGQKPGTAGEMWMQTSVWVTHRHTGIGLLAPFLQAWSPTSVMGP